jgi:hypothetical protein
MTSTRNTSQIVLILLPAVSTGNFKMPNMLCLGIIILVQENFGISGIIELFFPSGMKLFNQIFLISESETCRTSIFDLSFAISN